MTREELNKLTATDLQYIASIPLDTLLQVRNKNICSHNFLYNSYLIRVGIENNKVTHVFVTNSNMITEFIFSDSKAKFNYTFGNDCKRQNIEEIKDFLFEVVLLIKHTPLSLDYDGKAINKFYKSFIRKEKIRKLLNEDDNKTE